MALVKVDHIYKMMRKEEVPYWRLTDNAGTRNMISENDTEENIETAIELMEEALSDIEDNVVCVVLSEKSKAQKAKGGRGYKHFEFKINLNRKESSGIGAGNNGMLAMLLSQMEKTNQVSIKLMELEMERKQDDLKRQIEKLNKSDNFEKYAPYLNKFFGFDKPVGIAEVGTEDTEVNQDIVNKQQKIREALTRLAKVDANLPDTLMKLANFAEKNPAKYLSFIPMLS